MQLSINDKKNIPEMELWKAHTGLKDTVHLVAQTNLSQGSLNRRKEDRMLKKPVQFMIIVFIIILTYVNSFAVPPDAKQPGQNQQISADMQNDQAEGIGAASYVPVPEISAPSAILIEAESGQVLFSKNSLDKLHISAACKLMTMLTAVENADLSSYVTVSTDSARVEGFALNLEAGKKYQLEELLYAIMLISANDAAKAVAEHVSAGDISKFVDKMNTTAANLNMTNTHFINPTGLLEENQYTNAYDISLLLKYAISNPTFNRIFTTRVRPWYGLGDDAEILTSSNELFWSYNDIEGGKTGFNDRDKQTIISTAIRSNMRLICIILDSPEADMYTDAIKLFDYGFQNFRKSILVQKGEVLKTAELNGKQINLISQNDISYIHPIGENYISEFNAIASELKQPLKKAIPAGSAQFTLKDGTIINVTLYPETEVIPPDDFITATRKKIIENKDIFYVVFILLIIEALLLLFNIGKLLKKFFLFIAKLMGRRRKESE